MRIPTITVISWRSLRNVAYLLLIAVCIVLVVVWWPVLVRIWQEQALTFVGAIVVMICGALVQARNFLAFLDAPFQLRLWSFSRVWALSALANYLAPLQPGIAVRVAWLARQKVDVSTSLLATWRQLIVSCWVALAGIVIGLLLTGDSRGRWPAVALILIWMVAFVLRKLWLRSLDDLVWPAWLARRKLLLHRAATGITLGRLIGVAVQYVLGLVLLYWVYSRFGATIGVGQALILTCLVYASSMVSVLPGNLGVTEVIYMLGGHGLGLDVATAGALALLIRVAHIVANLVIALTGVRLASGARGHE